MLTILLLLAILATGFAFGRYIFPAIPTYTPVRFDIGDAALARIIHEARRAYQQSLGVFNTKSWNNLDESVRTSAINAVHRLRSGITVIGAGAQHFERAVYAAIVDLAKPH